MMDFLNLIKTTEGEVHEHDNGRNDLAKNVFAVHGVDDNGKAVLVKPKVSREQLLPLIVHLPPCTIGMEACSGAHHWARQFRQHGHTVKLMAPKFVTPYRMSGKRGKNDATDAAAICEAVTRPTCASFRSRKNTSKSFSACTARGRVSSKNARPPTTACAG
jgi:transposase